MASTKPTTTILPTEAAALHSHCHIPSLVHHHTTTTTHLGSSVHCGAGGCLPRQVVFGMDRKRNVCDRQRFNSRRFRGILPMSDKHTSYDSNKLLSPQLLLSLRKPTNQPALLDISKKCLFSSSSSSSIYILYIYIFISKIIIFLQSNHNLIIIMHIYKSLGGWMAR